MNWKIELTGDNSDLEELSKVFIEKDLSIVLENGQFILKSECFDSLSNHNEVETKVIELLKLVNAGAKLALDSKKVIDYESVFWVDENGARHAFLRTIEVTTLISTRISWKITRSDGIIETYNQANPLVNWMKIAKLDKSVRKAFDQINHDFNSWDAFCKIIEILEDDHFEHVRKQQKRVKEGKYRAEVNRLTGTANSYKAISLESRHARVFEPPENPMQFSEAKALIILILHEWLAHKEKELIDKKELISCEIID